MDKRFIFVLSHVSPTLSALQTCANSVDPNEMARNKPSHQDLLCLPSCFLIFDWNPFASKDMSKFKDGRVHVRSLGMKGLNHNCVIFYAVTFYYAYVKKSLLAFYSKTSMTRTQLTRLPWLIRTCFESFWNSSDSLTLVLLNLYISCLCKQRRSRSVCFWIWICTICH